MNDSTAQCPLPPAHIQLITRLALNSPSTHSTSSQLLPQFQSSHQQLHRSPHSPYASTALDSLEHSSRSNSNVPKISSKMSHRPHRPVEPHSLGPHHERPHIPHHGAHNAGGFGPFHPYQSSQNTSHSYGHGHPTFGHSFSPYSGTNTAHRQSPLHPHQGAAPQPSQASSQPEGAVTKGEVADDHPWPSTGDSSGKISEHVATTGRPVDIVGQALTDCRPLTPDGDSELQRE